MNTEALIAELDTLIAQDRPVLVKVFLRLLKQVWQIDWTVAAYDVMSHYLEFDIPYFYRFMALDEGDEAEENQLIKDWVAARLQVKNTDKPALINVISEVNELRVQVRQTV